MSELKFFPVNGRVLVEPQKEEYSMGGIALPTNAAEKPEVGTVIAVDDQEDHLLNKVLKPGTKIIFNRFATTKFDKSVLGTEYLVMTKDSILIVFKDEQ